MVVRRAWDKLWDSNLLATTRLRVQHAQGMRAGGRPAKLTLSLPTARSVQALDPSEAVLSFEIVPPLQRYFHIVESKPLRGSLLQFLHADIAGNLDNEAAERLLQVFFAIEDLCMASGELDSDFTSSPPREKKERRESDATFPALSKR